MRIEAGQRWHFDGNDHVVLACALRDSKPYVVYQVLDEQDALTWPLVTELEIFNRWVHHKKAKLVTTVKGSSPSSGEDPLECITSFDQATSDEGRDGALLRLLAALPWADRATLAVTHYLGDHEERVQMFAELRRKYRGCE